MTPRKRETGPCGGPAGATRSALRSLAPGRACAARGAGIAVALAGPLLWSLLIGCTEVPCAPSSERTCAVRELRGPAAGGELGFRFGAPRDLDGDGVADVAAGSRFAALGAFGVGTVSAWSGASGLEILRSDGQAAEALYGHAVLAVPDLDGDGLADVIVAAPNGAHTTELRGAVRALSSATGALLWTAEGDTGEGLGWDLAAAGDRDGDGRSEIWAGAPAGPHGAVYLLDGATGAVLARHASLRTGDDFGWYVADAGDLDADGVRDVLVGAPAGWHDDGRRVGEAFALSATTGAVLHRWYGADELGLFGEMLAGVGDVDGDGVEDVAIAAPHAHATTGTLEGEVMVYSGASGGLLHRFVGRAERELYGRMVAGVGDVDGDGAGDLAIGAPWHAIAGAARVGRVELRSGATGAVLAELTGRGVDDWFGWHIAAGPAVDTSGRRGMAISALRRTHDGIAGVGSIEVHAFP